jgi:hypothetical protein
MASIKVRGRVPVFCAWDGDVPLDADFMMVVVMFYVFFCECKLKTMIFTILTFCDCYCSSRMKHEFSESLRVVEVDRSGCYTDGRIEQLDS